jgi:hypothetical protein
MMHRMTKSRWHRALGVVLLVLAGAGPALRAQELEQIAWLAGCWAAEGGERGSQEVWMPLAGGTLLGVGRTVKGGKTVDHEFMQIRASGSGSIVYIAQPSGQPQASFALKHLSVREVVFENLEHDFPQRVMYRLEQAGRLVARIEGSRQGTPRGIDFPMHRENCDATPGTSPAK